MTQIPPDTREITVGQLSARSGVAISALHFYQAQGLISAHRITGPPDHRTTGPTRGTYCVG
jgi:MerR family transcriptional regulator, redox-sensitive transcriptional activator SoxR